MKKNHKILVSSVLLVIVFTFVFLSLGKIKAATAVNLGGADNFAVLAGSAITDTTPSLISGDVGLSPGVGTQYLTPVLTTGEVTGTIYAVDATGPAGGAGNNPGLLSTAQNDLTTAYGVAAGAPLTATITSDLGTFQGGVLTPGVYNSGSSVGLTGTVTLDGQGDPNAVFIIQAGSTLTTASNSHVTLINSAQACNVFWQVGSSATLGTGSDFKGNIIAFSSITDAGSSIVEGRFLARNAAVTLKGTHINKAICVAPPVAPAVYMGGGGGMAVVPPLINITKIPTPLSLPAGPGSVTYNYTVTNVGTVPMNNVKVTDDKCSNISYVSGDTSNDAILDMTETWKYHCTTNVTQTTTNTATATGFGNGFTVSDNASATVVVSSPIVPPLIHIVKVPNVFLLQAPGGPVTYSYSVTNPGTAPLSDVSVIDDKCTGLPGRVVGHPGDLNKNNLLDSGETFYFTCQTNLTQTTTNIGTAEGHANGLTAIDFTPATVVVATPKLPQTGYPSGGNNIPWNIIIGAGVLGVISFFYFTNRKKIV